MAMTQRTLYKTIEKIGSKEYPTDEEMLAAILREIVNNDRTNFIGGRLWKLEQENNGYRLIYEEGNIESVGIGFLIRLKDYAVFEEVARKRTALADETNQTLRKKGIMKYSATGVGSTLKIGKLAYYEYLMAFNTLETDSELKYNLSIAGQAATHLLEKRRSDEETRILHSELEHARVLQRQILPEHEFHFGQYELYGVSIPERIVGGDFFNYYQIPGDTDRLAVAIGDAASKGFPAAVQALFVSGALMMSVEFESKISSMLRRINTINRRIFPSDRFLTLFYCELFEGKDGLTLYANAGHPGPIHYKAETGACTELAVTGPIIGLLPDAKYSLNNCNIAKDDFLVLFSDGITEANDGENEYGEERLKNVIMKYANEPPKRICAEILQDVQVFSARGVHSDDKTIVVIKRIK